MTAFLRWLSGRNPWFDDDVTQVCVGAGPGWALREWQVGRLHVIWTHKEHRTP